MCIRDRLKEYFNLESTLKAKGLEEAAIASQKIALHEKLSQLLPDDVMTKFNALVNPPKNTLVPLKSKKGF